MKIMKFMVFNMLSEAIKGDDARSPNIFNLKIFIIVPFLMRTKHIKNYFQKAIKCLTYCKEKKSTCLNLRYFAVG